MKQIKEAITTYKTIYEAVDGRKFDNENDCQEWEKSYKCTMITSWNAIKKLQVNPDELGIPYSSCDDESYILRPENINEITLINAYIKSSTGDDGLLTINHLGKLICLNFGYDHDCCDIYVIEDNIKRIENKVVELAQKLDEKATE